MACCAINCTRRAMPFDWLRHRTRIMNAPVLRHCKICDPSLNVLRQDLMPAPLPAHRHWQLTPPVTMCDWRRNHDRSANTRRRKRLSLDVESAVGAVTISRTRYLTRAKFSCSRRKQCDILTHRSAGTLAVQVDRSHPSRPIRPTRSL